MFWDDANILFSYSFSPLILTSFSDIPYYNYHCGVGLMLIFYFHYSFYLKLKIWKLIEILV